ncbi:hypothetical protein DdX_05603 [Ditylenchus destructor]|uniref:Uncharacterized protein n=1 Tax=Ditylenchus destructor TaxID=166010 RepID=A0AAD4R9T4_9BILA|nr:hypothetical protein DdX_05603 [Ditylenchus destructor]
MTMEEIIANMPKDWLPPLPMFMKDASGESQQKFQQIINNVELDVDTKQAMVDDFISRQPEIVQKAYADFQKELEMRKNVFQFSLENELQKVRLQAEVPLANNPTDILSPDNYEANDQYADPYAPTTPLPQPERPL